MAYSDYGGYAYKNGQRVEERSDAVLSPEGIKSTPGMWPGWTLPEGRNGNSYHALLGDGPVFVSLYKQSSLGVHRLGDDIELADICKTEGAPVFEFEHAGRHYRTIDDDHFKNNDTPCVFEIDGNRITVYWRIEDNHYQYVQLEQPDGTIWHGWSGYGVGAGLEEGGYGYSTEDREDILWRLFERPAQGESA